MELSRRTERCGLTRREFLQAGILITAAAASSRLIVGVEAAPGSTSTPYYEPFLLEDDEDRMVFYDALGFVVEENGKKCVANPLLPSKCMVYTKPYRDDRFPLLPPGATEDFYGRCIRCGLCYFACNYMGYNAIRLAGLREGLSRLGSPVVDELITHPCTLCMECTKICPTGALKEIPKEEVKMGIALIDPDLCWAWNSGDCKSCAKACPFGSEVFEFTFNEWGVHTRVIADKCKGCGLCVPACPIGGSAIHVLPREEYERRTKNYKNTGMSYDEYLKLILETEHSDPFKATWRTAINTDYIQNIRGIEEEKITTELGPSRVSGGPASSSKSGDVKA